MKHYLIKWKGLYLYSYSIDIGSLWGMDKLKCAWMEETEKDKALLILERIEKIPLKELEVQYL